MIRRVGSLVVLAVVAFAGCDAVPPSFAGLRQGAEEHVPGSWGLVLRPPPDDLDPSITPQRARRLALRVEPPDDVFATLAVVPAATVGRARDAAAWVVFARNLCFARSKGDLVSSARRDPEDVERCSVRNLWVEIVDPMTGESLASLGAYDTTGRWTPATAA